MFKIKREKEGSKKIPDLPEEKWIDDGYEEEGQLSVDVYETSKNIIIKSPIAGVNYDNLDIYINNDMLTIRGERKTSNSVEVENYLYKECFWGDFSRSIILPVEVDKNKVDAELDNGILTISLKKNKPNKQIKVKIKE